MGIETINEIQLVNFTPEDADSIVITSYTKNSSSLVDSFFLSAQYRGSDLIIFTPQYINTDLHYKVIFQSTGATYSLTNFEIKKEECNSCFPWGHDYYNVIESYYVNSTKQSGEGIKIIY
jgi:hypothetical protein